MRIQTDSIPNEFHDIRRFHAVTLPHMVPAGLEWYEPPKRLCRSCRTTLSRYNRGIQCAPCVESAFRKADAR
jgi:hypothetical protein